MRYDLILRNVRPCGERPMDIGIREGRIAAIAERVDGSGPAYDGRDREVIPGLHDHHLHLFATAALRDSVDLSECCSPDEIALALRAKAARQDVPDWIRGTGFTETAGALPDHVELDRWLADRPLRVQDRTGALWLLNSLAIERLGSGPYPSCVELDRDGHATGRIWRGDGWLREIIASPPPALRDLSLALAAEGITALTDAGATNGPGEAALFEQAIRAGELMQRLTLMGTEALPTSPYYWRGPLKLLLDERDLQDPSLLAARISAARDQGRNVAAHCVTVAELIFYLEALAQAGGARPGDRIEHGSLIPKNFLASIAENGLIVVTQPGFIYSRGDRYVASIDPAEWDDLYRLRTLINAGIEVRASSDAPYGGISPWQAMAAAHGRRTRAGIVIGSGEALSMAEMARLFGIDRHRILIGAPADLCVLATAWKEVATGPGTSPVDLTLIGGAAVFERDPEARR